MLLWDARVAREAAYEARIEAAFDGAEAHALAGNLELALDLLSEAEMLGGGLPDAYIHERELWINSFDPPAGVVGL